MKFSFIIYSAFTTAFIGSPIHFSLKIYLKLEPFYTHAVDRYVLGNLENILLIKLKWFAWIDYFI